MRYLFLTILFLGGSLLFSQYDDLPPISRSSTTVPPPPPPPISQEPVRYAQSLKTVLSNEEIEYVNEACTGFEVFLEDQFPKTPLKEAYLKYLTEAGAYNIPFEKYSAIFPRYHFYRLKTISSLSEVLTKKSILYQEGQESPEGKFQQFINSQNQQKELIEYINKLLLLPQSGNISNDPLVQKIKSKDLFKNELSRIIIAINHFYKLVHDLEAVKQKIKSSVHAPDHLQKLSVEYAKVFAATLEEKEIVALNKACQIFEYHLQALYPSLSRGDTYKRFFESHNISNYQLYFTPEVRHGLDVIRKSGLNKKIWKTKESKVPGDPRVLTFENDLPVVKIRKTKKIELFNFSSPLIQQIPDLSTNKDEREALDKTFGFAMMAPPILHGSLREMLPESSYQEKHIRVFIVLLFYDMVNMTEGAVLGN